MAILIEDIWWLAHGFGVQVTRFWTVWTNPDCWMTKMDDGWSQLTSNFGVEATRLQCSQQCVCFCFQMAGSIGTAEKCSIGPFGFRSHFLHHCHQRLWTGRQMARGNCVAGQLSWWSRCYPFQRCHQCMRRPVAEMRAAAKPNATGSDPSQHNHLRRHHQCLQKQQRVERSSAYSRFHAKVPRWNQRHCVQCSHQCVWKGRILASCTPNLGHDGEGCWDGLTSQMLTKSWLKVTRFWPRPTIMYRSWLFNIVHCFLSLAHHFEFYSLGVSAESPDISRRRRSKLTLPAMTRWLQPPPAVDAESRSDHGLTEGSMMFYRVWTLTQSMWLCVCVKTLVQLFQVISYDFLYIISSSLVGCAEELGRFWQMSLDRVWPPERLRVSDVVCWNGPQITQKNTSHIMPSPLHIC